MKNKDDKERNKKKKVKKRKGKRMKERMHAIKHRNEPTSRMMF